VQYIISKTATANTPTNDAYDELSVAYVFLNRELFAGTLPNCLITLQRKKRTCGYFSSQRFVTIEGSKTDEIALNPAYFAVQSVREVLSTLAHEMVHLWQKHFGTPGRRCYHNREWADKMLSIGLHPSSTGRPGGREVGQRMSDYVIEGGLFCSAVDRLLATHWAITWFDRYPERPSSSVRNGNGTMELAAPAAPLGSPVSDAPEGLFAVQEAGYDQSNRRKYRCPICRTAVWGKAGLALLCGDCASSYEDVSRASVRSLQGA
jgi:SprT-like family